MGKGTESEKNLDALKESQCELAMQPDQRGQSLEAMLSVVCTRRAWETI